MGAVNDLEVDAYYSTSKNGKSHVCPENFAKNQQN